MTKAPTSFFKTLTLFLIWLVLSPPALGMAEVVSTNSTDYAEIDAYVQNAWARSASPGLAYAIVHDTEMVHMRAFGVADPSGRMVTTTTPFIIGSVGKTFTALAIRQLITAGRIEPGAAVRHYIPWFSVAGPQASAAITVQNLLDHKSGIPSSAGNQLFQLDETYDLEALVRRARTVKLTSQPGTTFEYSNVNYLALGLIVEKVSRQSYAEYVQQHILAPLGMQLTYLDESMAQLNGLASGYQSRFGSFMPVDAPFPAGMQPSGYAISTVEDMGKYLVAYLNKGVYQGVSIVDPKGQSEAGTTRNYGYDIYWNEQALDPNIMEGQSGGTLNFNADIQIIPESKWGVVVLMNSRWTLDGLLPTVTAASIANGIACRIKGWPSLSEAPLSYRQWYIIIDSILLIIGAFGAYRLARILNWRTGLRARKELPIRRQVLSIGVDGLVGCSLLALPIYKDYGLAYFLFVAPDIATILCSIAFVLFLSALLRMFFLIIERHNIRHVRFVSFYAGILVALCYLTFTLLAFLQFPPPFSPMMNWLSDLGNPSLNPFGASLYNIGIISTALLLALFFLGLSVWQVVNKRSQIIMLRLAQVFGISGSFCMMMSGIHPINSFEIHSFWSTALYILLSTALVFLPALLCSHQRTLGWLLVLGVTAAIMVILSGFFPAVYLLEWITVLLFLALVVLVGVKTRLSLYRLILLQAGCSSCIIL